MPSLPPACEAAGLGKAQHKGAVQKFAAARVAQAGQDGRAGLRQSLPRR